MKIKSSSFIFFTLLISLFTFTVAFTANGIHAFVPPPIYDGNCIMQNANVDFKPFEDGAYTIFSDNHYALEHAEYEEFRGLVFHGLCYIKGADLETFEVLSNHFEGKDEKIFAKDKNHVYFGGQILQGLDPGEFKIRKYTLRISEGGRGYSEDEKDQEGFLIHQNEIRHLFFPDQYIRLTKEVDLDSFSFYGMDRNEDIRYFLDKSHIYLLAEESEGYLRIKKGNPKHFSFGYVISENNVYWYGERIEEADGGSFEVMTCSFNQSFSKDKNNVYFQGKVIYKSDAKSFGKVVVSELRYCMDKKGFYGSDNGQNYLTIDYMKNKYPSDTNNIDQAIQTAITEYEQKYPGYEPKPAQPKAIFSDISITHNLYWETREAYEDEWINGYPDGTFKSTKPVNRAEFAKMLTLAFKRGEGNGRNLEAFPDVDLTQWYKPYLSRAVELNTMQGYPDGTMKPGNTINKAEALKMTLELIQKKEETSEDSPWYEKYRLYAVKNLTLPFLSEDQMNKDMTRGECVQLILEAIRENR